MKFLFFFWVYNTTSRVLSRVPKKAVILHNNDVIFNHLPTGLEMAKAEIMMINIKAALQSFSMN